MSDVDKREIARLKAEVRGLRAMIQQLVFLDRHGQVRWGWQDGLDLADKVPGLREIAQPVPRLVDEMKLHVKASKERH